MTCAPALTAHRLRLQVCQALILASVMVAASARGTSLIRGAEPLEPKGQPLPEQAKQTPKEFVSREGLGENLPFPSSDYVGVGYDIYRGNPEGDPQTQSDPGFRIPLLQLEWSQDDQHLSRDMRNLQPVGGYAMPEYSCQMSKNVDKQSNAEEYSSSLSVDASVEGEFGVGGFGEASFKASAGYAQFSKSVLEEKSSRFMLRSYCLQFLVGLDPDESLKERVIPYVEKTIADLPAGEAKDGVVPEDEDHKCAEVVEEGEEKQTYCFEPQQFLKWRKFFERFGTHATSQVHLGGKLVTKITISQSEMQKASSMDVSAEISASYDSLTAGGSVKASTEYSQESTQTVANMKKDVNIAVFGGLPPQDTDILSTQGFGEWAKSVREAPMPVRYQFLPFDKVTKIDPKAYHAALKLYAKQVAKDAPSPIEDIGPQVNNVLHPGDSLERGESLESKSGYKLVLKDHSDNEDLLVLELQNPSGGRIGYLCDTFSFKEKNGLWRQSDYIKKGSKLELKTNCDLQAGRWRTETDHTCGSPGKLKLQEDGDLVLSNSAGKMVWHTDTADGRSGSFPKGVRVR